ncbi:collagen alpha-2(VIII) chain-like [Mya arenaria]|uniref:collagen alpha-2(VIII) chain-like n=1 Tax=Mya arenaria TaxID=6604 RepID=UPI0022DED478|nr:collagen alpha-2(VIII) chain-like [Mya arenaria]
MAYKLAKLILVIASVWIAASLPVEPQSWLSLVEQLLEKMVRMELNVEAMHKEMQQARDQVTSGLSDLDAMKQTVGAMQTYITDNTSKSDTAVAFNAHTIVDKSPATGQVLVFSNPLFNIGEAYDSGAGIFTTPVSGVYIFSAHFCLHNAKHWYYAFMKENDVVVVKGHKYESGTHVCEMASAVVLLLQNERLWIECRSGSTDDQFYSDANHRSSFSGALLHRVNGYP